MFSRSLNYWSYWVSVLRIQRATSQWLKRAKFTGMIKVTYISSKINLPCSYMLITYLKVRPHIVLRFFTWKLPLHCYCFVISTSTTIDTSAFDLKIFKITYQIKINSLYKAKTKQQWCQCRWWPTVPIMVIRMHSKNIIMSDNDS